MSSERSASAAMPSCSLASASSRCSVPTLVEFCASASSFAIDMTRRARSVNRSNMRIPLTCWQCVVYFRTCCTQSLNILTDAMGECVQVMVFTQCFTDAATASVSSLGTGVPGDMLSPFGTGFERSQCYRLLIARQACPRRGHFVLWHPRPQRGHHVGG